MSRDIERMEVDIGTPWRAARALISQYTLERPERIGYGLLAMSVITGAAMVATALYELDATLRRWRADN